MNLTLSHKGIATSKIAISVTATTSRKREINQLLSPARNLPQSTKNKPQSGLFFLLYTSPPLFILYTTPIHTCLTPCFTPYFTNILPLLHSHFTSVLLTFYPCFTPVLSLFYHYKKPLRPLKIILLPLLLSLNTTITPPSPDISLSVSQSFLSNIKQKSALVNQNPNTAGELL